MDSHYNSQDADCRKAQYIKQLILEYSTCTEYDSVCVLNVEL